MTTVDCSRCKLEAESAPAELPLPPDLAELVQSRVCERCWKEWQDMEVMVINELRLNFLEPASQEILHSKMKEFFELEASVRVEGGLDLG